MSEDILSRKPPEPDARIPYGREHSQFGALFLPKGAAPHPVIVAIHGGFWRVQYDLTHLNHLCRALSRAGYAVWSLEYRRLGEVGGGWPGTFDDVAAGTAQLKEIAAGHQLDLDHVISLGHSAGGHLALWLAAQHATGIRLRGVVALAAVSDLALGAKLGLSNGVVSQLLDGTPHSVPERYAKASPAELLPLRVAQRLVHGTEDDIVPLQMSREYAERARKAGDAVILDALEETGHFELIDPESTAWGSVLKAVHALI